MATIFEAFTESHRNTASVLADLLTGNYVPVHPDLYSDISAILITTNSEYLRISDALRKLLERPPIRPPEQPQSEPTIGQMLAQRIGNLQRHRYQNILRQCQQLVEPSTSRSKLANHLTPYQSRALQLVVEATEQAASIVEALEIYLQTYGGKYLTQHRVTWYKTSGSMPQQWQSGLSGKWDIRVTVATRGGQLIPSIAAQATEDFYAESGTLLLRMSPAS